MKIGAMLVTYNRLDKLKETLVCFEKQTYQPSYILIVDNASTDGTIDFLKEWEKEEASYQKYVIFNDKNLGGSGGFYTAFAKAKTLEADWIWVSDDDAMPRRYALENANTYLESHDTSKVSAICGAVYNHGEIDLSHRHNLIRKKDRVVDSFCDKELYDKEAFALNCFSYVGVIVKKEALLKVGLTRKEYFIWWDDTEHSLRFAKVGSILCVPSIQIDHDVPYGSGDLTWKSYYGFRNYADLLRRHFGPVVFWSYVLRMYRMTYIKKNNVENKMVRAALKDCLKKHFGMNEVYKPGWK